MDTAPEDRDVEVLDEAQCLALLASVPLGRIAFTEGALPGCDRFEHGFHREGLRYGEQADARNGPVGGLRGGGDCRFDSLQVGSDCGHNQFSMGNIRDDARKYMQCTLELHPSRHRDYKWTSQNYSPSR